ncbi:LysR family transcriptional regulator [Anaeromyxobacter paludicola]|uniref:HTH-type transcriptional regulator YwbI n=1 Tax=Anaeromyxobacter paludicola TaxID=2918171 RepID=A0ABN6N5F4_9BACT|nr:LysR family transcriptional regulator [Anaeromyxobacter paludicola]BDG07323.1 putative HTH-type transcriptional regulator YwbI [Anaeromyxobacter paludicola]
MDVRGLRAFVEVARRGGFTRAGAALHLTQPSVSKLVRGLEDELGVPLLLRERGRVVPTDAGRVVLERAQGILGALTGIEEELSELAGLRRGRVRVGLPPMVGGAFFPEIIADFRRRHPGVALELREEGARAVEALVRARELDAGVTLLPTDESAFEVLPLVQDRLRAVVHPGNPLARRRRLALADLAGQPLVLFRPDFALHDRILAACRGAGFTPEVVSESAQWDFIAALVAADLGVALLPGTICARLDPRRVRDLPLDGPEIAWNLALVWRRDPWIPPAVRAWIDGTRRRLPLARSGPAR